MWGAQLCAIAVDVRRLTLLHGACQRGHPQPDVPPADDVHLRSLARAKLQPFLVLRLCFSSGPAQELCKSMLCHDCSLVPQVEACMLNSVLDASAVDAELGLDLSRAEPAAEVEERLHLK